MEIRCFFSIISRKVDKPQRAWKAVELIKKYTEPARRGRQASRLSETIFTQSRKAAKDL